MLWNCQIKTDQHRLLHDIHNFLRFFNENVIFIQGFLNPVQQDYIMDMTGKQPRQGKEQEQKVIGRQGWNGILKCYLTENA